MIIIGTCILAMQHSLQLLKLVTILHTWTITASGEWLCPPASTLYMSSSIGKSVQGNGR